MQQVDEALAQSTAPSTTPTARTPTRSPRSSGSTARPARYADLLGIYEKRASSRPIRTSRSRSCYEIAKLYETELKDLDERDRDVQRRARRRADRRARARGARRALPRSSSAGSRTSRSLRRRIELDGDEAELIDLKYPPRPDAREAPRRRRAARSRTTARSSSSTRSTTARARRSRRCSRTRSCAPKRPRILENIYEERGDWEKLLAALEILARGRGRPATARRAPAQDRARRERDARTTTRARSRRSRARSRSSPHHAETRAELEQLAESLDAWEELDRALRRDRRGPQRRAARARVLDALGAIDERARQGRRGGEGLPRTSSRSTRPTPRRSTRSRRSSSRTERWTDLIGVIERRIELTADPERARAALRADGARLRRAARSPGRRDRVVQRGPRARSREPRRARRARRALHAPGACGASSPRTSRRSSRSRPTTRQQIALMLRLAALRETRDEPGRAGDRRLPPGARARRRRTRRRSARSSGSARSPTHELVIAEILEPLYRQIGDYQKLIGVHEVQVRRSDDADAPRRAPPPDRAAPRGRRRRPRHARSRRSRARSRRIRRTSSTQDAIDRLARATGRFADLARVFEQLGAEQRGRRARQRAHHDERARLRGRHRRRRDAPSSSTARCSSIDPAQPRGGRVARAPLPSAERYAELSLILQRKARDPRRARATRRTRSSRPPRSKKTCSSGPRRRSPSTRRSSRSTRKTSARSTR